MPRRAIEVRARRGNAALAALREAEKRFDALDFALEQRTQFADTFDPVSKPPAGRPRAGFLLVCRGRPSAKTEDRIAMMRGLFLTAPGVAGCVTAAADAPRSWAASNRTWVAPFDPFKIEVGVYFIGVKGLSSFLVTTPEGHFLIDGGLPENTSEIAKNTRSPGFRLRDVKYLLDSHAHFDHSGGLAALRKLTGANHPEFFDMEARRARQIAGDDDAFVDADAFPALMERLQANFERVLAEQTAAAGR